VFFSEGTDPCPENLIFQCYVLARTKTLKWKKQVVDNHLLHKWNRPYRSSNRWAKQMPLSLKTAGNRPSAWKYAFIFSLLHSERMWSAG